MRREIVSATKTVCHRLNPPGGDALYDDEAEAIARAVLRAALTGEAEGRYGAAWYQSPYGDSREFPYVFENDGTSRTMRWRMVSMAQAHAVANALNLSRDLVSEVNVTSNASIAAGGNDGE